VLRVNDALNSFKTNQDDCRPIVEYFRKRGLVTEVECSPEPPVVWEKVKAIVAPLSTPQPPQQKI
jgi:hypothetical protein